MAYVASSSIGEVAKVAVMRDMMAVGPSVMSLAVPRKQYTKHPMKAEYKPYWREIKQKKYENCTWSPTWSCNNKPLVFESFWSVFY